MEIGTEVHIVVKPGLPISNNPELLINFPMQVKDKLIYTLTPPKQVHPINNHYSQLIHLSIKMKRQNKTKD